jgi:hypothetical protein
MVMCEDLKNISKILPLEKQEIVSLYLWCDCNAFASVDTYWRQQEEFLNIMKVDKLPHLVNEKDGGDSDAESDVKFIFLFGLSLHI